MCLPPSPPASEDLTAWQAQAAADDRLCVVGGLIVNPQGGFFVQKRSPDRRLFPGCWDIAGGHVEPGETLLSALEREIAEETGWHLERILTLVETFDWEQTQDGQVFPMREFDFLVQVSGDLDHPQLEHGKFTEFRWVGAGNLAILAENRLPGDDTLQRLVGKALEILGGPHCPGAQG